MNTAEAEDDSEDPGALAAVGCLRAISTILESVSRLPNLFVHIEPTMLPIMRRMLTTDGQGIYASLTIFLCIAVKCNHTELIYLGTVYIYQVITKVTSNGGQNVSLLLIIQNSLQMVAKMYQCYSKYLP